MICNYLMKLGALCHLGHHLRLEREGNNQTTIGFNHPKFVLLGLCNSMDLVWGQNLKGYSVQHLFLTLHYFDFLSHGCCIPCHPSVVSIFLKSYFLICQIHYSCNLYW